MSTIPQNLVGAGHRSPPSQIPQEGQSRLQQLSLGRPNSRLCKQAERLEVFLQAPSNHHRSEQCSECIPAPSSSLPRAQPCSELIPAPSSSLLQALLTRRPWPPHTSGAGFGAWSTLQARCRSAPRCVFHARHIRSTRHIPIVPQLGHERAAGRGSQPPAPCGGAAGGRARAW